MTYACPAWKFAADTHLFKVQRLQNEALRITATFTKYTPVRELHMGFQVPYIFYCRTKLCHVRWVPCHYGMARPQVEDGGDALQVRRVAANILNKQLRAADKGWSSSLGIGRGA
jgi:hypothetical protein